MIMMIMTPLLLALQQLVVQLSKILAPLPLPEASTCMRGAGGRSLLQVEAAAFAICLLKTSSFSAASARPRLLSSLHSTANPAVPTTTCPEARADACRQHCKGHPIGGRSSDVIGDGAAASIPLNSRGPLGDPESAGPHLCMSLPTSVVAAAVRKRGEEERKAPAVFLDPRDFLEQPRLLNYRAAAAIFPPLQRLAYPHLKDLMRPHPPLLKASLQLSTWKVLLLLRKREVIWQPQGLQPQELQYQPSEI
ncbi:hypothetical protein cyc_04361 [Cyclospora cayetanensis]|uniref:Uncharacterized protein n=1 Tax=Cyclospora cayetanensis TaxID=88456 RepID=A0A1D3CU40_9EIME|nr:hypothetical protein cyc_04361 [Cyclospora cayetanensis]